MLGGILPEVLVGTALHDGKQRLVVAVQRLCLVEPLHAALQPPLGESQRLLGILVVAVSRGTLVECHHDVGTDDTLGIHHVLGGEDMLRTVNMAAELTAFLLQLADAGQRKDLKTARIGQDRTVPRIKLMQTACLAQDVQSRAQIQVISIAQNNLCLHLFAQFCEMHTFHATHRSYGHKDGSLYLSVVCGNQSCAGTAIRVVMLYFKFHFSLLFSSSIVKSNGLSTISLVSAKSHTSCTFST